MTDERNARAALAPTQFHPSRFESFRYAYPAVSRRARGVSIGVNLSPTKLCNFRCVYCQVQRGERASEIATAVSDRDGDSSVDVLRRAVDAPARVDLDALERETTSLARAVLSGALFERPRFAATPLSNRVLRDFAFSGDGEPTLARQFPEVVDRLVAARRELNYDPLKLVLITNATRLRVPEVASALDRLAVANGEIWTKLDATNDAQLRAINRTRVEFETIFDNIVYASQRWSVKIQTALFSWRGCAPTRAELDEYCGTLARVLSAGGRINAIQLYTVAREPVESAAVALPNEFMDEFASVVRAETGLEVEVFYSR
ncbi:MAG: radical SAM protein [Thermoguttaceae bacterium]|nr:radical SAM protein [Thermoguttaceae bacterium]